MAFDKSSTAIAPQKPRSFPARLEVICRGRRMKFQEDSLTAMKERRIERICVFCGSSAGRQKIYVEQAGALGRAMAAKGLGLVYGAGGIGLMGAVADAVIESGGEVTGVIPYALAT